MTDVIDERDQEQYEGCCALKDGHEGCCAFRCSVCDGSGRTDCLYDDLGCECGFCGGYGDCAECSGNGWFNDAGEPCWVGRDEWGESGTDPQEQEG